MGTFGQGVPAASLRAGAMNSGASIRILSIDEHPLMHEGVAALIASQEDMTLVAEAGCGRDAIALFRLHRPSLLLMDLYLPDMTGIETIVAIRSEFPSARIIVLTTHVREFLAWRALKAGAQAYLLKDSPSADLVETIRAVCAGYKRVDSKVAMQLVNRPSQNALSDREIKVLELVAAGMSNKRIANEVSLAEETVKSHIKSILSKLEARDRTHAVVVGLSRGVFSLGALHRAGSKGSGQAIARDSYPTASGRLERATPVRRTS